MREAVFPLFAKTFSIAYQVKNPKESLSCERFYENRIQTKDDLLEHVLLLERKTAAQKKKSMSKREKNFYKKTVDYLEDLHRFLKKKMQESTDEDIEFFKEELFDVEMSTRMFSDSEYLDKLKNV